MLDASVMGWVSGIWIVHYSCQNWFILKTNFESNYLIEPVNNLKIDSMQYHADAYPYT